MVSGLGDRRRQVRDSVTAPSEKPSLVEPARRLLLKSKVKEAGLGAWLTIRPKLRVSPIQVKAPSSTERRALAGERVALALGLRLELEGADVEAVEIDLVEGAHVGRPAFGRGRRAEPANRPASDTDKPARSSERLDRRSFNP